MRQVDSGFNSSGSTEANLGNLGKKRTMTTVTTGSATGLGQRSVSGSGAVTSSTYYFAFWQNKMFDSYLVAYDMPSADAHKAADDVNQRIR
jgi:hypothetical protein